MSQSLAVENPAILGWRSEEDCVSTSIDKILFIRDKRRSRAGSSF